MSLSGGKFAQLLVGRLEDAPLERLPLVVELMDEFGQLHGPLRRFGRQELDRQLGLAEPAGRVEPRTDREGNVFAGERRLLVEARHVLERLDAGHRPMSQAIQPVPHQHAVFIHQRHDVGHRADRREPHRPHQIVPHRLADALRLARPLAKRPGELQRDRRPAQTGERIRAARQAGMHDRRRARQPLARLVMIRDDQRQSTLGGRLGFGDAGDAAVDGDDDLRPFERERPHRVVIESVAFVDAIGHVVVGVRAQQLEAAQQNRGRRHAVGVVVAVDDDPLLVGDRLMQNLGRCGRAGQAARDRGARSAWRRESRGPRPGNRCRGTRATGPRRPKSRPSAPAPTHGPGRASAMRQILGMTSVWEHGAESEDAGESFGPTLASSPAPCYFFFSTCSVCLRSRGLNLLSFSFSPPVLRRIV